jgi:hypothetical protein
VRIPTPAGKGRGSSAVSSPGGKAAYYEMVAEEMKILPPLRCHFTILVMGSASSPWKSGCNSPVQGSGIKSLEVTYWWCKASIYQVPGDHLCVAQGYRFSFSPCPSCEVHLCRVGHIKISARAASASTRLMAGREGGRHSECPADVCCTPLF